MIVHIGDGLAFVGGAGDTRQNASNESDWRQKTRAIYRLSQLLFRWFCALVNDVLTQALHIGGGRRERQTKGKHLVGVG